MSKTVRILLAVAFVIFVAGIIWAIAATRHHKKTVTQNTPSTTPTLVSEPATTTATPPAPAPQPTTAPAPKKVAPKIRRVIITETTDEDWSASASASAGVNADGSTWANASAN